MRTSMDLFIEVLRALHTLCVDVRLFKIPLWIFLMVFFLAYASPDFGTLFNERYGAVLELRAGSPVQIEDSDG